MSLPKHVLNDSNYYKIVDFSFKAVVVGWKILLHPSTFAKLLLQACQDP